jgi:CheY-like chemotaxis protein
VVHRATPFVSSHKSSVMTAHLDAQAAAFGPETPVPDTLLEVKPSATPVPLVLLIDDDEVILRLLERALRGEHYRSRAIGAGRGLDLSLLTERPFAIVVDITVPDVDGFEIIPRLNQHPLTQGVPIIMMSTRSGLKDRRSVRSVQNFLTKPFRPSQLLQMLRKFASAGQPETGQADTLQDRSDQPA